MKTAFYVSDHGEARALYSEIDSIRYKIDSNAEDSLEIAMVPASDHPKEAAKDLAVVVESPSTSRFAAYQVVFEKFRRRMDAIRIPNSI